MKAVKRKFGRAKKKVDDSTPNVLPTTPEYREPGQSTANAVQTGQASQQPPGFGNLMTAFTPHANQETRPQEYYNRHATIPQSLQGHDGDSNPWSSISHSPYGYPMAQDIRMHVSTPQPQPQQRYQPRFLDPRDVVKYQGELSGTPVPASSVMERPRPLPRPAETYELPDAGPRRPTASKADMQTAAANLAFAKFQPPKQYGSSPAASSLGVGAPSSSVAPARIRPSLSGTPQPPRRRVQRTPREAPAGQGLYIPAPQPQQPPVQGPLAQKPLVQEPLVQEQLVQEPLVQEPLVQEPLVQEPLPLPQELANQRSLPQPLPLQDTSSAFGDRQPGEVSEEESNEESDEASDEESHGESEPPSLFGDASFSTTLTGSPSQQRQPGLETPSPQRLPEMPEVSVPGVASEDISPLATTSCSTTGAQYPPGSRQDETPAQISPPSLPRPGVADGIESRIKAYLERRDVPRDPVHDGLGNLIGWFDKEQDRFNKEMERIRAENQGAQEQLLLSFDTERQGFQQTVAQVETNYQAASDQAQQYAKEIDRKDLEISRLTSELDASRRHAASTEAKRKNAEEGCQTAKSELREAQSYVEQLRRINGNLTWERDNGAQEINHLREQIQDLNSAVAQIKASYATDLETKRQEHEEELRAERRQRSAMAAQHMEDLAAKDRLANSVAEQHRAELGEKDQQWGAVVQQYQDKLATQDHQHREELGRLDHQLALLVEKHAEELKSREDQLAAVETHYQQRLAEVEGSVQAEIDRAQKENRVTIGKQRQQIASYSKDSYIPIDDALFTKSFQALVQDVNQLASRIRLPPTIDFDPSLDPTRCLERNARQRNWIWPRFVRNLCWQVLLRGFFSLPFGFGALGNQGEGYHELQRMYQATARLALTDDADPAAAMPNEKDVNLFRASYMERILSAVRADTTIAAATGEMAYAGVFRKNVDLVGHELYDTLHHIVNGQLDPACFQQASAVAHKLGILALEMGTQRARVWLETCRYREHSTPDEWKTEETASIGAGVVVDLMVHPCLSRVGDGRGDLNKKKVVVKGEFVPLRT